MVSVNYGGRKGKRFELDIADDLLVVRTSTRTGLVRASLSESSRRSLAPFRTLAQFPFAGVEILSTADATPRERRDLARSVLKTDPVVEFAGRVLVERQSHEPAVYTENLFIKFDDKQKASDCRQVLAKSGLSVKSRLSFAKNGFFANAEQGTGLGVFDLATELLATDSVEFCHPEIIRRIRRRRVFPGQWHLARMKIAGQVIDASANVRKAWKLSTGKGVTVAIIDDGFDWKHEEFSGAGKVVARRDVTRHGDDPNPGARDNHGTACAGVAVASGKFGASGVAPDAKFMPIRCVSALGSIQEAEAFAWAADHGADVISCSWGPWDGDPDNPADPLHQQVWHLPDSTRLAIDYAVTKGRTGKGCVICFAAGNGNESVDHDGYASYGKVIAVAACTDSAQRSYYSDHGKAIWCAFPSNGGTRTPGIYTTDRRGGAGYNPGHASLGAADGDYTNDFGGTSSACPGVAGVAALMLSVNPSLSWGQVRAALGSTCDKIDTATGNYAATGRSPLYGYGRVNALNAVKLAKGMPRATKAPAKKGKKRAKRKVVRRS